MGGIIPAMSNVGSLAKAANHLKDDFWPLIKSRQTFLLTLTGAAGYLCQVPAPMNWLRFAGLAGSLLVTISGCTVLNMVFDRDIDRKMKRTSQRPLAANQVEAHTAATLGGSLIGLGLVWALGLSWLYCLLILTGACLDVLVYTVWLKRRSAWSIILGGLAGGMPILAGRALVIGRIEATGLLLALAVVCWIPSHNLTLAMLYSEDYLNAGVPTFLNIYGLTATRSAVAVSSVLTVLLTAAAFDRLGFSLAVLAILGASGLGLVGMALYGLARSSNTTDRVLYKYSSIYMLAVMLLLVFAALKA
jgi:protoheme IX farnesyltransferase